MDVKQQTAVTKAGIPDSNPMNLTCKPASGGASEELTAQTRDTGDAASKYAVIMNATGPAQPPNSSWTTTVFTSTVDYTIESQDGTINFTIPAGGLGIYSK